jgi:NDP-sugar pyrophosphorylase family protein
VRSQPGAGDVSAVVFAAGLGTRLLPVTTAVPKPLVTILDVPLVDLAVRAVARATSTVVVNAGHLDELVAAHLASAPVDVFRERPNPYGNAATLRAVLDRLSRTVVTYNCDLVSDLDVRLLLDAHRRAGRAATLACTPVERGGDFVADGGSLRLIDGRTRSVPGYLFLGAACFERDAVERIPEKRPLGLIEALVGPLLARGEVNMYVHAGYARDAGTLTRLLEINLDALTGKVTIPFPGRVVTNESVSAYVGPGAVVADESLGAGAIIGAGASVHPDARISSSLIWKEERIPAGTLRNCIFFRGEAIAADPSLERSK